MVTRSSPTLDEVAKAAGVSRATASRAINGGHKVSPQAMQAVSEAVAKLGFTPNRAARSLATKRTDSIALVIPEPNARVLSDPFFGGVLNGLSAALKDTELQLIMMFTRPDEDASKIAKYLSGGHVDGAVIVSHHAEDLLEDAVLNSGLPSVFMGRPIHHTDQLTYTDVDNAEGGAKAANRLIEIGCQKIATVSGPSNMSAGMDRLTGWRLALQAAGYPTHMVEESDFAPENGAEAIHRLMKRFPDIDGLFVASDTLAGPIMDVLRKDYGKRIPHDIAVIGFDDIGLADAATPPLTTIRNPVITMAHTAVALLLNLIEEGQPATPTKPRIFPAQLTIRESA